MELILEPNAYRDIMNHLLPVGGGPEQAAYLYVRHSSDSSTLVLSSYSLMAATDFAQQADDYLELTDEARAGIIKRAHDTQTALIEMHSHPGPWPAAFSLADRIGLRETVPHMQWRLPNRPYIAIVVAKSGFDALVWAANDANPQILASIRVGSETLKPTNLSIGGRND